MEKTRKQKMTDIHRKQVLNAMAVLSEGSFSMADIVLYSGVGLTLVAAIFKELNQSLVLIETDSKKRYKVAPECYGDLAAAIEDLEDKLDLRVLRPDDPLATPIPPLSLAVAEKYLLKEPSARNLRIAAINLESAKNQYSQLARIWADSPELLEPILKRIKKAEEVLALHAA